MSPAPLILASGSPRRRDLLREMGIAFEVITASVVELDGNSAPGQSGAEIALANARLKARAVARTGRWVLGADTVVTLGETIFGKPASLAQAREFLRALSGRTHEVVTGCALLDGEGAGEIFHEATRVTFRTLSDEAISGYLARVQVLDKAGAYALQEEGDVLIERVEGSRSNVIGLPTERLGEVLRRHGLL